MGNNPCGYGFSNTGFNCVPILRVTKKIFFVPTFSAKTGNRNGIFMAANGVNLTTTSVTFNQPAFGANVSVTFGTTVGMQPGMILYIKGATGNSWVQVISITSGTVAVVQLIGQTPASSKEGTAIGAGAVTQNGLSATGTFVDAFFQCLLNHPDPSQRWYATPEIKDAMNKRAPSITQGFKDQTKVIVQQGLRTFTGMIPGKDCSPQLLGYFKSGWNQDMSILSVDAAGNLIGTESPDPTSGINVLYPTRIDSNSIDPLFNPGEDDTTQEITLTFDVLSSELDEQISMLSGYNPSTGIGDIDASVVWADYLGLLTTSVYISNVATSTTSIFNMQVIVPGGTANQSQTDKGLSLANFISPNSGAQGYVYDATAAADVAVSTVVENTDATGRGNGTYVVTLGATITAAHKVSVGLMRNGRDNTGIPGQAGQSPNYTFLSV